MNCPKCGRELIKIANLTKEEIQDYTYANQKVASAETAFDNAKDICADMNPEKAYVYFKAVFDELAEGKFLEYYFSKELENKYPQIKDGYEIIADVLYVHS